MLYQMVIGYFLDSIIGFFLALSLAFHEPISTKPPITKHGSLLAEACKVFFDCAVFFAISIQISCVVVLVRRDFGISANGLGGLTVQITWAVALICMLPLIYPMLEQQVLSGFEAAGFIVITTYGLLSLLWFIITRRFPERAKVIRHKLSSTFPQANRKQNAIWCMNIAIPLLTIPQLWGVLRLRGVQKRLADATSNVYVDNQWTFGQVVAVMIFVPVFTEVGYLWIKERGEYKLWILKLFH
jgi:hypothetical protein